MSHPPSLQLITDAVVAQYIHEISGRHRVSEPEQASGRQPVFESGQGRQQESVSGAAPAVDDADRLAA